MWEGKALLATSIALLFMAYLEAPIDPLGLGSYTEAPFPKTAVVGEYLSADWREEFSLPLVDGFPGDVFGLRIHPITKALRLHAGGDYPAPGGTPVLATRGGVVAFRGTAGGYGRLIRLTHGNGFETRYAHLGSWSPGIHAGITVRAGQIIGYVGKSGKATGPHLHYEVRLFGRPLNPAILGGHHDSRS